MLTRQALAGVIEPRVEEIFSLVHQVMRESGYEELLSSGIVITGGSAVMPGMVELGEDIFLKPVRTGMPTYRGALPRHGGATRAADRHGPARGGAAGTHCAAKAAQQDGSVKTRVRPRQGLHPGELLRTRTRTTRRDLRPAARPPAAAPTIAPPSG